MMACRQLHRSRRNGKVRHIRAIVIPPLRELVRPAPAYFIFITRIRAFHSVIHLHSCFKMLDTLDPNLFVNLSGRRPPESRRHARKELRAPGLTSAEHRKKHN
jgi:hypothetical protein